MNKRKRNKIILGIVVLLVVVRLVLPYILLHYANKSLANMKGYYGHVDDLDLSLYRGAYTIHDIYLNKIDSLTNEQTEFFKSKKVDTSIEWEALFHGSFVGEFKFLSPVLKFTKHKVEIGDLKKDLNYFQTLLDSIMPLKINRVEMTDGEIHYIDFTKSPKVDVSLKEIHLLASNLTNVIDKDVKLPSTINAEAVCYGGTLSYKMKLNALEEYPTFDINAELKNTKLVQLNDFLTSYAGFDVNKGSFGLYTEMAAKEGKFKGYVKPLIKDLDVVGKEDKRDKFFQKLKESLIGAVGVIFRNPKSDQVATKVSFEGDFSDPKSSRLDTIWELVRNAFIQALLPSVDNQININSPDQIKKKDKRTLLQKIFNSKKK